jgi:hypothetical protein
LSKINRPAHWRLAVILLWMHRNVMFSHDRGRTPVVPDQNRAAMMQSMISAKALAYFDTLAPTSVADMLGDWQGAEITTGHPMDGMLAAVRWCGKSFESAEAVHPLVHTKPGGQRFCVNPALLPMQWGMRLPLGVIAALFALLRPVLTTRQPKARLRMITHRDVQTAAMVYDAKPIIDVFRKIDDDTVLGLMDQRGDAAPFFFTLSRL